MNPAAPGSESARTRGPARAPLHGRRGELPLDRVAGHQVGLAEDRDVFLAVAHPLELEVVDLPGCESREDQRHGEDGEDAVIHVGRSASAVGER
jgi:hypothetical protein